MPASPLSDERPAKRGTDRPVVLLTGAAGNIGRSLVSELADRYLVVGLDQPGKEADFPLYGVDLTDADSINAALATLRAEHGSRIASVVHLAAYFDFSGEENPLYKAVNIEGTRHLLRALQDFEIEQFVYASTMLVHAPGEVGRPIDEDHLIEPGWAYPRSKAEAERVITEEHGQIPYVLLRLAGLYDERTSVPTLAHQIARIHMRDLQSHFYSGSRQVGQSMVHRDDMLKAIQRTIDRRADLSPGTAILIGEPEPMSYDSLQDELGYLIHGAEEWPTLRVPKPVAAAGAWAQQKLEPVIPDAIDQGEEPFIKPFMVQMADDHYELNINRARRLLDWQPRHRLKDSLPAMVAELKRDPLGWYEANGIPPPPTLAEAAEAGLDPECSRRRYESELRAQHSQYRWAHFANIGLGLWLIGQAPVIGTAEVWLVRSEIALGLALVLLATLSLSWQMRWARLGAAAVGALVMAAPLVFWTTNPAAYLSDTMIGGLAIAFALGAKPDPGPSPLAATSGQVVPAGWSYNPSSWHQRLPIILMAVIGLEISRYFAAYQLGHIEQAWDPFFAGAQDDARNGTEEIITSQVAEAWPVPDAAVGAYVYAMEIIAGFIGSRARWRTMPWLVVLFGMLIAPLGVVSIFFIIIQPIVLGTWSTLALVAAAAMLVQIPYVLDELFATLQFVRRRVKAGRSWLRVFLFGDTDEGGKVASRDEFDGQLAPMIKDMWKGGVGLPWNLALAALVGVWLMFTRLTLGTEGGMADADHLVGALALTAISLAAAEVARPLRFLLIPLGTTLFITPYIYDANLETMLASFACGAALILLSLRCGPIAERYGTWQRFIA